MPSSKMCEFQLRGECRYGLKCWNSHDLETSRQRALFHATTVAYEKHLASIAQNTSNTDIDAFITQLQQHNYHPLPAKSANFLIARARAQDLYTRLTQRNSTSTTSTDALIVQVQAQDISAMPSQSTSTSTTSTNALIAQVQAEDICAMPSQSTSTSTTSTNALIAQVQAEDICAMPSQSTSTSTTSTNALIAQIQAEDICAMPSQSTSTNTTSTNALIAQVQAEDICAMPSQSTSTNTTSTNALIAQVQTHELQLQLEASMRPIFKQPDNSKIALGNVTKELSGAMKTENDNCVKETASNFHALHQKKMKKSTENNGSVWDDILMSAIDSDLLCNICFEIFIKPTVLNCSHTFCESCIIIWTNRVIACPICRVEVKSKSYCLTLESFIEKIVEHLPKEIKDKREVTIKDRSSMEFERSQQMTHRLSRSSLAGLMYGQQRANATIPPPQYRHTMDRNVDFNTDVLVDESEIFRMNLHDTVVSTRGVNPLMSYIVGPEEQTLNRRLTRPYNSSARH